MSTFIKSIDSDHLVTTGSEGGFNRESSDWTYNGADGTDFDAEVKLKNIDFGTFHSYPQAWSKTTQWVETWIHDHAEAGNGKPVLHEEYGWTEKATRVSVLSKWQAVSRNLEMSDMYWQFGYSGYSYGKNHDDGNTIYLEDDEAQPLVYDHAAAVNGEDTPPSQTTSGSTAPGPTATGGARQVRYGQCGGLGWTGPVLCESPWTCKEQNQWYSQCL